MRARPARRRVSWPPLVPLALVVYAMHVPRLIGFTVARYKPLH